MISSEIMNITGIVSNIQRFSIHDGPGIRTTLFLKGCPLKCAWCSNPETQRATPQLLLPPKECTLCGSCKNACPEAALEIRNGRMNWNSKLCTLCGRCLSVCPSRLPNISGRQYTVGELLKLAKRDQCFYEASAEDSAMPGGITLSGGEPFLQPEFTIALLTGAKSMGISTCIETTLYGDFDAIDAAQRQLDWIYCDLKHVDSEKHRQFTGVSNELILNNMEKLLRIRPDLHIRIPVIPGFNDAPEEIDAICAQLRRWNVRQAELMRYHNLASPKYHALGREYPFEAVAQFTDDAFSAIRRRYADHGIEPF